MQAVVFCNSFTEIFDAMPEVADIVPCLPAPQADVVRSVADEFELLLDLRMPSRAYGPKADSPTQLSEGVCLDDRRPRAVVPATAYAPAARDRIMLESLGLPTNNIDPIFKARSPVTPEALKKFEQAIVIAPGAGGLGALKKPSQVWWETLIKLVPKREVIQIGAFDDPLGAGATDGAGLGDERDGDGHGICHQVIAVESGLAHLARAVRARQARGAEDRRAVRADPLGSVCVSAAYQSVAGAL